jgi:hypothetical protein
MKYFVLRYEVVENYAQRRAPLREEHLKLVREAHARGEIVMAGALGDPPQGALVVFRAESPATAESFARADPYVTRGLVTRWTVQPWTVVVGQ